MINGKLVTYENNSMSLSCKGEIEIKNSIIKSMRFSGYPRTKGDSWVEYYTSKFKIGDTITSEYLHNILLYHGSNNIISYIT